MSKRQHDTRKSFHGRQGAGSALRTDSIGFRMRMENKQGTKMSFFSFSRTLVETALNYLADSAIGEQYWDVLSFSSSIVRDNKDCKARSKDLLSSRENWGSISVSDTWRRTRPRRCVVWAVRANIPISTSSPADSLCGGLVGNSWAIYKYTRLSNQTLCTHSIVPIFVWDRQIPILRRLFSTEPASRKTDV